MSRQGEKVDKSSMKVMNSVIQKKSQNASLLQHFRSHYVTVGSQKTPGCLPPIKPLCCQASEDVACKVAHLCRPEGKLQVAKAIHLAASVPRRWGDGMEGGKFRTLLLLLLQ